MLIWILIILGSVLVDQLSKWLIVRYLDPMEPFVIWEGVFRFSYVENEGAAFGMLSEQRWIFMVLSVVAILGLLIYLWKWPPESKWGCVAISLIAGGGVGNMIDRVRLGYVVDFLDFYPVPEVWPWVFNVADACVCIGGAILFVWCIVSMMAELRAKKKSAAAADAQESDVSQDNQKQS